MMNISKAMLWKGTTSIRLPVMELTSFPVTRLYSPHSARKARPPPRMPSTRPSMTKGRRIKPLVAPTIFMMAISSRRPKVASLMVLDMMKKETNTRITISTSETAVTTLRIVTKLCA